MDFQLGCNYWASHAGIYMWRNWDKNVVEQDMQRLQKCGVSILRVFPLWADFQPLTLARNNSFKEFLQGDQPLDRHTPEGAAGVDPVMMERFREFLELAKKYSMQLIIPLITGWMSGRMFFPPAFADRNPISDCETIKWELRFVRCFVEHFKHYDNILAWEAGNETNVMSFADEGYKQGNYYVWLSNIAGAIRSADPSHPVIAGIHGLTVHGDLGITISEVGEICDVLTVHPYAAFVPHCYVDGYDTMRSKLHATTESIMYSHISGKPCLCEEIGHLGNSLGCEESSAQYLRANLYALWAHGFPGLLWWCAFDQEHLTYAPYDWCACEQELGLLRSDGTPKAKAEEMLDFKYFVEKQEPLPPYQQDMVCILSKDQDTWAVSYSVNLLCKQAGLDVKFVDSEDILPETSIYLLPSLTGDAVPKRTWRALMEKVEKGATLYISWEDAILANMENITGMKVISNAIRRDTTLQISVPRLNTELTVSNQRRMNLSVCRDAAILGTETDGNPAFTCHAYGEGKVYFLPFPLETQLADQPGAFEGTEYYRLYQLMFSEAANRRITAKSSPQLAITEHPVDETRCTVVVQSYSNELQYTLTVREGWRLQSVEYGQISQTDAGLSLELKENNICRFTLIKRQGIVF